MYVKIWVRCRDHHVLQHHQDFFRIWYEVLSPVIIRHFPKATQVESTSMCFCWMVAPAKNWWPMVFRMIPKYGLPGPLQRSSIIPRYKKYIHHLLQVGAMLLRPIHTASSPESALKIRNCAVRCHCGTYCAMFGASRIITGNVTGCTGITSSCERPNFCSWIARTVGRVLSRRQYHVEGGRSWVLHHHNKCSSSFRWCIYRRNLIIFGRSDTGTTVVVESCIECWRRSHWFTIYFVHCEYRRTFTW